MPRYDVVERHQIGVEAPASITFAAAMDVSLDDSITIQAIFKGRELFLGAAPDNVTPRRSLIETTKALGWAVLADVPGREIVMGAVTQPWQPDVVFRGVPADQFASFDEPGYVKIVWTLRADVAGPARSIARTETRAIATDPEARRKFRAVLGAVLAWHRADSRDRPADRQARCRAPGERGLEYRRLQ